MSQLFRILPAEGMLEEADGAAERVWRTRRRFFPPSSSSQNLARWPALWTGWRSRPACGAAIRSLAPALPSLARPPARSHYPPASLPPLSLFSDTEKGTPPPPPFPPASLPRLPLCLCPPFTNGRQTPFPFFIFF